MTSPAQLRALVVPDWRDGNPYLTSLGGALGQQNVTVAFQSHTRRILPLWRLTRDQPSDLLHLHWPEAFWLASGRLHRLAQQWRLPIDLGLVARSRALVYTAHNLFPHDEAPSFLIRRTVAWLLAHADAVIAHSTAAGAALVAREPSLPPRLHIIPHGDLLDAAAVPPAHAHPTPPTRPPRDKVALMFGVIQPYKGIEEILLQWPAMPPEWTLRIVGSSNHPAYLERLTDLAADLPSRVTIVAERLSDAQLAQEIADADAVLFNYRRVFTSGAACLARSIGTPIVLPAACTTVDLAEPSPVVFRFNDHPASLPAALVAAGAAPRAPTDTACWREHTSWSRVAALTATAYQAALARRS